MTDQTTAPTTATEARAVLDVRMADKDWGGRLFNGDAAANKELRELTRMVAAGGDDTVTVAMTGNPASMPTRELAEMANTTALFRELGIRDEVTKDFLSGRKVEPREYELVTNWKREAMGDAEFVKKYLSGDVKARQQMLLANSILVNGVRGEAA